MTHKMLKAARSLGYRVGHGGRFLTDTKGQDWRQIGTQNKCKTFFYIFSFLVYKDICNTLCSKLTA